MNKITGGCLCGAIRYESSAQPEMIVACHCSTCQKNTGSAFSVNIAMPQNEVSISGSSLVTYEERNGSDSSPFYRSFCAICGSPVSGRGGAYPGVIFLKAGTLDDPSWVKPTGHMWCAEKQPWVNIDEDIPQFAGAPE